MEIFSTIVVENVVFKLFREFLTSLRNSFFEPLFADQRCIQAPHHPHVAETLSDKLESHAS